ncbi:MAG TPA: NAD-dependent epimerase/dehydratase family protein [Burkholderiales bacterium]|nr:NAD-dependent epimerase/dehydratase family protein [Burkholderiales bacterium]
MRALIVGGAGFIGSHLARRLLRDERIERLVVYDDLSSGSVAHVAECRNDPRFELIRGDAKQLEPLASALHGIDVVYHLAANPDISKAEQQPDIDFWDGTYLAQNVLEAMRIQGVKRIFYTSGSGVYGHVPSKVFAEDYGPCLPISTYGASKLACEALICAYCHMFGLIGRVFRVANVVGPRQTHGVGYDFIRRLRQDASQLRILGNGLQCKSYIHVDDMLAALFLVSEKVGDDVAFDVFNVASDDTITVNEVADLAVDELGIDKLSVCYMYSGGDRGWKGDTDVLFDVTKIRGLGWRATRSSSQAMREALRAMIEELAAC